MTKKEISLGIDLGFHTIKFVEIYKEGADFFLKEFAVASTNFTGEESEYERCARIKQLINTAIKEKKFNTQNVFLSISNPLIFTRFIKVPITDTKKISQMISFEALQQIPFPLEEVIWDYQVMRTDIGEAEALLTAIKSDVVFHLLTVISESLHNAEVVDIGPLALGNVLYHNEDYASAKGCKAYLSFGMRSSYCIVMNEEIFWLRILPMGGENVTTAIQKAFDIDFETAEEYKVKGRISSEESKGAESDFNKRLDEQITSVYTKIIFEFKRSLNFFRTQHPGKSISSLSLIGGGSAMLGLEEFVKKNFTGMDTSFLKPLSNIILSDLVDKVSLGESEHLLGEAIGLALRGLEKTRLEINFMPKDIISNKMRKKNLKYYIAIAGFAVMVFLSKYYYDSKIAGIYEKRSENYAKRLDSLQVLSKKFKNEEKQMARVISDVEKVRYLYKRKIFWLDFISHLERLKTEEIWFTELKSVSSLDEFKGRDKGESKIGAVSLKTALMEFQGGMSQYIVIFGETSSEYTAISNLEEGLRKMPMVLDGSVQLLFAKSPIDGVRAFAIGVEFNNE